MSKNKSVLIKGNKIRIKNLTLEDVYKMRQWGIHENPLLIGYNFPNYTDKDIVTWYNYKTKPFYNKYFSIYLEDRLIGYLGMKKISRIFRRSTLGIVLDPNFINKGYGTDVLITFLNYYFYELKMKKMYLDVDLFNQRALKLYLKLGFKITGKYLAKFIDDYVDVKGSYYLENENAFVIKNYKVYNYRYTMLLEKDNFKQKYNARRVDKMSFYLETTDMDLGDTPIENIFINDYMPMANGTYVKVYLLGFKYAHDRDMDIEVDNETIARHLEIPMEDVLRAWDFWEEKGIIKKIRKEDSGYNFFVKFLNLKQLYIKNNIDLFSEDLKNATNKEEKEKSKTNVSKTKSKTKSKNPMMQLIDANRNPDINNMFNNIDNILRRQTVPIEKQKILSWISDYNMPPEVIEKAFLYSVESRDIRRFNYIEAIVRNWYDEGITTLDKVLDEFNKNDEKYFRYMKIMKELGLASRPIKDDEKETIDTWFKDGFTLELILEACKRDKNPVPSIRYVNGILESWKIKNITSVDDIEVLDVKEKKETTTSKTNYQNRPKQVKTRFHNFEQRSSNYSEDELEDIARRKREEHMKKLKGEV